jgi:hypothetical protein
MNLLSREFTSLVELGVETFSQLPGQAEEKVGYFSARSDVDGRILTLFQVGTCRPEKWCKYATLSLEKGERLFHFKEHQSSWKTRNEGIRILALGQSGFFEPWGKWGGAIRLAGHQLIFSFSGLPELGDEAVVLWVAVKIGLLSVEKAKEIATISSNPFLEQMLLAA